LGPRSEARKILINLAEEESRQSWLKKICYMRGGGVHRARGGTRGGGGNSASSRQWRTASGRGGEGAGFNVPTSTSEELAKGDRGEKNQLSGQYKRSGARSRSRGARGWKGSGEKKFRQGKNKKAGGGGGGLGGGGGGGGGGCGVQTLLTATGKKKDEGAKL